MLVSRRMRSDGFTLIELLIVIAIILILIAIALPNFLAAQARAKVTREKADIRTIATAIEALRSERGVLLVDFWDDDSGSIVNARFGGAIDCSRPVSSVTGEPPQFFACCCWHNWNRRGGTTGLFTPLTTPVRYLMEVPPDPFAFEIGDQQLIHQDVIPPISYMYHDRELKDLHLDREQETWRGTPNEYTPSHPAGVHGIMRPLSEDHYLVVGFGPDHERFFSPAIPYAPTNGATSRGDVIYRSDGGF